MVTYGKRKKGLLSPFSVFQDDKSDDNVNQQPSTRKHAAKSKTTVRKARSRGRLDESSGDELADTAILYNVPHGLAQLPSLQLLGGLSSDDITRPKSSKSTTTIEDSTRPKSSKSTKTISDDTDKPLPPVPLQETLEEHKHHVQDRPALTQKTTNMKAAGTKARLGAKPKISAPILQETTNASISVPNSSRPQTSHTSQSNFSPQASTTDAAELSRKITNLMAQAAAQETQTRLKTDAYVAASAKLSPLERSKNAFVKASRAIKERLSNSSIDKSSALKRPNAKRHSSYHEACPLEQYQYLELSRGRLDRRIAEGENLSNPKIRSLTGDSSVPRRPLPVYESMRSRSMRSESAEDPFSDGKEMDNLLPPQDYSGFDFDFNKRKHKAKGDNSSQVTAPACNKIDSPSEGSNQYLAVPSSRSGFSNMVSGLAQHPDVMHFSSSPLGHSTPRIRLEPHSEAILDNQDGRLLTRSPSILEFSFEDQSDDGSFETASPKAHRTRASDGSSLSVKRKGATEDLRSQVTPATKKAKTDSTGSKEDLGLLARINDLDTGSERPPLSPKSVNEVLPKASRNAGKRRGMGIFGIGKGKAPDSMEDELSTQARTRPKPVKRSSIGRPSSVLFSRGRTSRNSTRQTVQADEDAMEIDELQFDDGSYLMGAKKRR